MSSVPVSKFGGPRDVAAIRCAFCEQSFLASNLDIAVAYVETASKNTGWFCAGCWSNVQSLMASGKKGRSEHAVSPKRARPGDDAHRVVIAAPGPERNLPAEVWGLIFKDMDPSQLLRIRQTCRYWRDVVDGSNDLLARSSVHFPSGVQMDQHYQPEHLRPATRAAWRSSGAPTKLVCVDAWWPTFAQSLTHLDMEFTEVSLATLLDMLRCTPNLENFSSGSITHGSSAGDVAFQLDKMESLRVQKSPGTVAEKLAKICPRVKSFRVDYFGCCSSPENRKIFRAIKTLQRSLEEIVLVDHGVDVVHDLCELKHLKLKKISLDMILDANCGLAFCKMQPDLEFFEVAVDGTNEGLREIGQSCPKLKNIDASVYHNEGAVPTFLNTMSELELLRLSPLKNTVPDMDEEGLSDQDADRDILVNFGGIKNEHLKELDLNCMRPDATTLLTYVKQSLELTSLHLDRCTFAEFADMMAVLQAVESLETVKLSGIILEQSKPFYVSSDKSMNRLKRLEVYKSDFTTDEIDYLLSLCPMLEELTLKRQGELMLNHKLGSLKKLDLRKSVCSPRSIASIVFCCSSLKELLVSTGRLSADCRGVLEKVFGEDLLIVG